MAWETETVFYGVCEECWGKSSPVWEDSIPDARAVLEDRGWTWVTVDRKEWAKTGRPTELALCTPCSEDYQAGLLHLE